MPRNQFSATAAVTLAGAVQSFVTTNFATWVVFYPHTADGLLACYVAAIPYFQNTLLGDAAFVGLLFGGLALAERAFPVLRDMEPPRHDNWDPDLPEKGANRRAQADVRRPLLENRAAQAAPLRRNAHSTSPRETCTSPDGYQFKRIGLSATQFFGHFTRLPQERIPVLRGRLDLGPFVPLVKGGDE